MQTSLIICTFNRSEDLYRCLNSISELNKKFDEIIIVEQGDISKTKKITQKFKNLNLQLSHYSIPSLAQARNFGIQLAHGEFIYFIDDDTRLIDDYVKISSDYFNEHPEVMGLYGETLTPPISLNFKRRITGQLRFIFLKLCLQYSPDNKILSSGKHSCGKPRKNKHHSVQWLPGNNMVYRKKVFDEGLMFNPDFLKWSAGEDIMLSYQVHKKYGAKSLHYIPEFQLMHYTSPEISMKTYSYIRMEVIYRFIFWHREVYQGSFWRKIHFFMLQIYSISRLYNIKESAINKNIWLSYRYLYKNWDSIANNTIDYNSFIFGEDQIE